MNSAPATQAVQTEDRFRHEALFYRGEEQFVTEAGAFLGDGIEAGEPMLVVVSSRKIDLLRKRLGPDADKVQFADMQDVGLNPARIIPAWSEFVHEHGDRPLRGIGEPIWAERSADELVECQRHESLLNVAFAGSADFTLLCPYDTIALGPEVLGEATHSHPFVRDEGTSSTSREYLGLDELSKPFAAPLSGPPASSVDLVFQEGSLGGLRKHVAREASHAGLLDPQSADAATAVNEIASNSLRHAGGWGVLRMWRTDDAFVCEVSDDGRLEDPLVGRIHPDTDGHAGRGLWIVNQLCDLVQVRSGATGTTVRMHFRQPRQA